MKEALAIHDKLCETVNILNQCFLVNCILTFFAFTSTLIFVTFSLYEMLVNGTTIEKIVVLSTGIVMFSLEVASLVPLFYQSNRVKVLGLKLLQNLTTSICCEENHGIKFIATLQLSHQTPKVSHSLYIVDWPLLMLIISSVFSYLIIVIQFEANM